MTIVSQTIPEHLRWQAEACGRLGSPLYASPLSRAAEDVAAGGVVARVIGERPATNASALALRLMGLVHRLVLEGEAPKLAAAYPSAGGHVDPEAAWAAFAALIEERFGAVDAGIDRPVQTAPLAWLRFEPVGDEAALRLTVWPGGVDQTLAWSGFHGQNVRWVGP